MLDELKGSVAKVHNSTINIDTMLMNLRRAIDSGDNDTALRVVYNLRKENEENRSILHKLLK